MVELSRRLLDGLREVEPNLRRQAAEEVADAVQQQEHQSELSQQAFADSLRLECISLHECGELHYRSPEFFPGRRVTVYFERDLSFAGAEVYE